MSPDPILAVFFSTSTKMSVSARILPRLSFADTPNFFNAFAAALGGAESLSMAERSDVPACVPFIPTLPNNPTIADIVSKS